MKAMTKFRWVLGLWLLCHLGVAVCEALVPPVRIMPLGDSITQGCCSGTTVQGGYRNKLYQLLTSAGYNVDYVGTQADTANPAIPDWDHQGMGGYRIDQIRSGLAGWLNAIDDPDVVLLLIGVNDFWQGYDLANVQTRMSNLIADIATSRPYARIIVSNLPLRTDNASLEALQATFNDALPAMVSAQVALGRHVSLVDMHSAWVPADLSDGVHPKLSGYDKMAAAWLPAITRVITPLGTADPPEIVRTNPLVDLQHVTVRFSKPLADSAVNLANFSVNNGLSLSQAVLDAATLRDITLTTSTQNTGVLYTLTVTGVSDRTPQQNLIVPGSTVVFSSDCQTNGSFETDLAGWGATGNVVAAAGFPYIPTQGTYLAVFNGGQTAPNGVLSQAFATTAGQTYSLKFDAGVLAYNKNSQSLLVTVTGAGTLLSQATTFNGLGGGVTRWLAQSYTFVANSATTTLTFRDQSASTNNLDLLLDNVHVTRAASAPNTAPVAAADAYVTYQNTALVIAAPGVLANDTDAESSPLTAVPNAGPLHGSLTLNASGDFTYTPAAGYTGADSFTYHASDGSLDSNIVTVSLTVNAAPTGMLANGSFEADLGGWSATGNVVVASGVPYVATDGSKLAVFNGGQATPNGVLTQAFATTVGETYSLKFDAGVLAYNKNPQSLLVTATGAGALLSQSITLNGLGGGAARWVAQSFTFVANSTTSVISFQDQSASTTNLDLLLDNVRVSTAGSGPNTAPVAAADAYTPYQNIALVIAPPGVLANDTDAQSTPLTAVANVGPLHGSLTLNANGGFTYTPAAGYTGSDSFTYHASDGSLDSNIVTVSLTVNAVASGLLVNGGFEADLGGWSASGNVVAASGAPYIATEGSKLAVFNGGQSPPNGVLTQAFATTAGQTYSLMFDAGVLAYNKYPQSLLVTVTGAGTLLSESITLNGLGGGATRWAAQSFSFVANSTTSTLTFRDQSAYTNNLDLLLDNVRLTGGTAALTVVASVTPLAGAAVAAPSPAAVTAPPGPPGPPGVAAITGVPGAIVIRMPATQDGAYVLERSLDLKTWEYVSDRQCVAPELLEFHDTQTPSAAAASAGRMYYRIGFQPTQTTVAPAQ
jgi:VCBS repeat-containing protein